MIPKSPAEASGRRASSSARRPRARLVSAPVKANACRPGEGTMPMIMKNLQRRRAFLFGLALDQRRDRSAAGSARSPAQEKSRLVAGVGQPAPRVERVRSGPRSVGPTRFARCPRTPIRRQRADRVEGKGRDLGHGPRHFVAQIHFNLTCEVLGQMQKTHHRNPLVEFTH